MFIDKEKYTAHIVDNEKIILMRQLLDKIENVLTKHTIQNTDFFDPYEIYLAKSILNRFDIGYIEDGGIKDSERKIIQIFPDYYDKSTLLNPIKCVKLTGDISKLSHKDFLGSLLNLGIKRSKVGDIILYEDYCVVIVKEEISDFILLNLGQIGNQNILIEEIDVKNLYIPEVKFKELKEYLASTRLDIIISATYNISRMKSANIIKSGRVKVNWESINKPSTELEAGDVISIRGYGRAILHSIEGLSKKGRVKTIIRILI